MEMRSRRGRMGHRNWRSDTQKNRVWSGGDGDCGDSGPPGGLEEAGGLVLKQRYIVIIWRGW